MSDLKFESISPSRKRLTRLLQDVHFGRIERLLVRDGQPLFDPAPRVVRTLKIGGHNNPRPQAGATDFALRTEVVELLEHLDSLGDGCIPRIEVCHGLPVLLEVEDPTV